MVKPDPRDPMALLLDLEERIDKLDAEKDNGMNNCDEVDLRLMQNDLYYLTGELTQENLAGVSKWLILMGIINRTQNKEVTIYINSEGGDLHGTFALIDLMTSSHLEIRTVAIGEIASAAFLVFISGQQGRRYIGKNTSVMCHEFSDTIDDVTFSDQIALAKENRNTNQKMIDIIYEASGLEEAFITKKILTPKDVYLSMNDMFRMKLADKYL